MKMIKFFIYFVGLSLCAMSASMAFANSVKITVANHLMKTTPDDLATLQIVDIGDVGNMSGGGTIIKQYTNTIVNLKNSGKGGHFDIAALDKNGNIMKNRGMTVTVERRLLPHGQGNVGYTLSGNNNAYKGLCYRLHNPPASGVVNNADWIISLQDHPC